MLLTYTHIDDGTRWCEVFDPAQLKTVLSILNNDPNYRYVMVREYSTEEVEFVRDDNDDSWVLVSEPGRLAEIVNEVLKAKTESVGT